MILVGISKAGEDQYRRHENGQERTIRYNERLCMFAQKPRVYFADIYSVIEAAGESALWNDGLHVNVYGNKLIAAAIFQIIKQCRHS
jgi:lysophospholipase L1-like esterase